MLRFFLLTALAGVAGFAQPARLELLSRSDQHVARKGGNAMSALPEFSRDGNFVLFLSQAANLTTKLPGSKPVLNLYMLDLRTSQTTLLSAGLNGEPANDNVTSFEISADNRRVLIETAATNMIANDTNNFPDVFLRDLDSGTNILVSATTNGVVGRRGSGFSTMNADGNVVAFVSGEKTLAAGFSPAVSDVYVRNIAAGITKRLSAPPGYVAQFTRDPAVSDDGRYVAFNADVMATNSSTFVSMNVLYDLQNDTSLQMGDGISGNRTEPIMTPDGKYVTFSISNFAFAGGTNVIVRATQTGTTDLVASNSVLTTTRPVAISNDGRTILYIDQNGYRVFREGSDTRVLPRNTDGSPMVLPAVFGISSLSSDGKFVTFSTEVPLLASDGDASQFRSYIYDVEQDSLAEIPMASPFAPVSDPVPNADASVVLFTGVNAGIQEESEPATYNIYSWQRANGQLTLLSRSYVGAFENTSFADSKISELGAFSDDAKKMVFASRAAANDVTDTNGTWDVFVLDRVTGQKRLISISVDGNSAGTGASVQPMISANGQFVAFISAATNLTAIDTGGRPQLYVRDLINGVTHLVKNKDGGAPSRGPVIGSLSFSANGKLLCFASAATNLDARDSQPQTDVFVYDTTNDSVTLVSYDATNTTGANADCSSPLISPDGKYVAFRTSASNLGIGASLNYPLIRNLQTGVLRRPELIGAGFGNFKPALQFNPTSTTLYFAAGTPGYYSFVVTNAGSTSGTKLVTGAIDGSASADGKWIAFTRREATGFRSHVYLLNVTNRVETWISSNVVTGAAGNDSSFRPRISADGRFTVFESRASNLVANDQNGATDIFLYDRVLQRLDLVSATASGASANGSSVRPVISPDQNFVAFVSFASNLAPHDYNDGSDIFAAYLPAPDTDADGIDDRWELAHFGTLDHDMTGDADSDGMSDAEEFQAQTDPNQASSTLRVISATVDAGDNVTVRWTSVPGGAYRLQARSRFDVASQWQDVSDPFVSAGTESAITLTASSNESYFRVITSD